MTNYPFSDLEANITPKEIFLNRRQFIATATALGLSSGLSAEELTPTEIEYIKGYTNYYEFGFDKESPAESAQALTIEPWTISIEGDFERTGEFSIDELLKDIPKVKRVYRFRCVEAWAMVVPWNGVELGAILRSLGLKESAKYIAFETVIRENEMPNIEKGGLNWPYREGLRVDEALHPLTLLATGLYDEPLPKQNGAPIRLVVPWKYGFKSIKSIIRITAQSEQPTTTWNEANPSEYGFYANVNPEVSHPRWSQADERILGAGLFGGRQQTLLFNGYNEVASLYKDMDLKIDF